MLSLPILFILNDVDSSIERFYSLKFFLYPDCRIALPNLFRITQTLSAFEPDLIHLMTEFNMGVTGLRYGNQGIWDYMKWFHNQNELTLCPSSETQNLLKFHGIGNTAVFSRGIDSQKFHPSRRSEEMLLF